MLFNKSCFLSLFIISWEIKSLAVQLTASLSNAALGAEADGTGARFTDRSRSTAITIEKRGIAAMRDRKLGQDGFKLPGPGYCVHPASPADLLLEHRPALSSW